MQDPVLDQKVVLITQTDVTKRVDVERKLAELTAAQMSMLEQVRDLLLCLLWGLCSGYCD